ncbi:NADPH:quinone oxidoreductase family protein [Roseateles sp. BYS87W]|uniref:NADPH:quinone oxidoreductase family protein n=1 Tax=Pelomonas baiyunensis TaxID=3299026 RepID=A0ABW7GWJ5_9BURK
MKAWLCENPVGVEALAWRELPSPTLAPGHLRVAVHAASLNFPDLLIVQNKYQMKPPLPFIPGTEFSGVVTEVADGVKGFTVGQRVAAFGGLAGFATEVCIPAALAMPLPDAFSFEDAAAFICTYATSHHALMDRGALQPGETVLILGAAGGVGTAALQIAKAAGARVIAAVSSDAKANACRALGADAVINYTQQNLRDELKALTEGKGPDVVYDPVGGDLAEAAFRSIAWRGRYLVIGFAQGSIPALPLNLALLKGASLVGVFWGEFAKREPQRNARMLAELAAWYAAGKVKPVVDQVLPMEDLPRAFARMAARDVVGKLVLTNA